MQPEAVPELAQTLGLNSDQTTFKPVPGGSISRAYCLSDGQQKLFIKCMDASEIEILRAEQAGLDLLANAQAIVTPNVVGSGQIDQVAWLAMQWMDLCNLDDAGFSALGRQLAQLHRSTSDQFGLEANNFIGRTLQINRPESDWTAFFFEHRIGVQLRLLDRNHPGHAWEARLEGLHQRWIDTFAGYRPEASLLHGDCWSGNTGMTTAGRPVVFDPAVHYGDRECDLAMADLFGGFNDRFYRHYEAVWPLASDWAERRRYYQLYHLLNHANLFGGHYVQICQKLIRELG